MLDKVLNMSQDRITHVLQWFGDGWVFKRDLSFSACAKFSELTFVEGVRNVNFLKNLAYVLNK